MVYQGVCRRNCAKEGGGEQHLGGEGGGEEGGEKQHLNEERKGKGGGRKEEQEVN